MLPAHSDSLPAISSIMSEKNESSSSGGEQCSSFEPYNGNGSGYYSGTPLFPNINYQPQFYLNQWPVYPYYTPPQYPVGPLQEVPLLANQSSDASNLSLHPEDILPDLQKKPKTPRASVKGPRQPRPDGVCSHCSTTVATLWRRNEQGFLECNACNLYFRRNGVKRPLELVKAKPATRNRRNPAEKRQK
uniref:GATA-type domain-containing protein n=1 Tax=Caenorhabditis japonica TaxID=281687 RepID=A0A8R1E8Z5_CAEJA